MHLYFFCLLIAFRAADPGLARNKAEQVDGNAHLAEHREHASAGERALLAAEGGLVCFFFECGMTICCGLCWRGGLYVCLLPCLVRERSHDAGYNQDLTKIATAYPPSTDARLPSLKELGCSAGIHE